MREENTKENIRELILKTALEQFTKHGIKDVKMNDIASTLSISKRTIYELFNDKEQLLYELQDPQNYFTPDVIADFSNIHLAQVCENVVSVSDADGKEPNHVYKTSVGYHDCYIGIGEISYGGYKCKERAQLAADILKRRFELTGLNLDEVRYDLIGLNSLYANSISADMQAPTNPVEVRLRVAGRSHSLYDARRVGEEVEALYTNGPFGGGGVDKMVKNIVSIASILVPAEHFEIEAHLVCD